MEKEKKERKPIEKIKLIMTRNKDDEPELYEMLGAALAALMQRNPRLVV